MKIGFDIVDNDCNSIAVPFIDYSNVVPLKNIAIFFFGEKVWKTRYENNTIKNDFLT